MVRRGRLTIRLVYYTSFHDGHFDAYLLRFQSRRESLRRHRHRYHPFNIPFNIPLTSLLTYPFSTCGLIDSVLGIHELCTRDRCVHPPSPFRRKLVVLTCNRFINMMYDFKSEPAGLLDQVCSVDTTINNPSPALGCQFYQASVGFMAFSWYLPSPSTSLHIPPHPSSSHPVLLLLVSSFTTLSFLCPSFISPS
jgi:hypothetical protein